MLTTYYCGWCYHRGTNIGEQMVVERLGIRYVCYYCGNQVRPGQHPATSPAQGSRDNADPVE